MRNDSLSRKITPRVHGYLDYTLVAVLAIAPTVFGWNAASRNTCYAFAAIQLALSLLTAYPLGAVRMIPFTVHAAIELITSVVLIAIPWAAGFNDVDAARNFFIVCGLGLMAIWAMTDYKLAERGPAVIPDKVRAQIEQSVGR